MTRVSDTSICKITDFFISMHERNTGISQYWNPSPRYKEWGVESQKGKFILFPKKGKVGKIDCFIKSGITYFQTN